jgi:protein-glutamine gamma-glutamyltransferase
MTTLRWPVVKLRANPERAQAVPPLPVQPLLYTLGALAMCMLPFWPHQPLWLNLLLLLLLAGRAALAVRGGKQPPAWTLVLLALLFGRALVTSYATLAGRDGGTAMLLLLVALKTLETSRRRDALLLVLLGYFLTATQFFFDQNAGVALYALLCALALTACVTLWARPGGAPMQVKPRPLLGNAGRLLLQAAPLTLVLFVLFPRPDGPLWQIPVSSSSSSKSGLSDSVTPGSVSSLAQDDSVAFRASFQGTLPAPEDRYWRGPVLEGFDGRRWSLRPAVQGFPRAGGRGQVYKYRLTLEPSGQPWALALDVPTNVPSGLQLTNNLQLIVPGGVNARRQLDLEAVTNFQYGQDAPPQQLDLDTFIPEGGNPRARALAASWAGLAPAARVQAAYAYFGSAGLEYTLNPPLLVSADPVDELLYGTKLGFCEHFASSFAYLMRAAGIPARVVTGYLGGTVNASALSGSASGQPYLIVRQADAHAWVEVWLAGQGWVRIDPTAAVSPARLQGGLAAALPDSAAAALESGQGLFPGLRLRLDALQNAWNQWVIGYDFARQQGLLTRLGLGEVGGTRYVLALTLLFVLTVLPALWVRSRRRGDALLLAYQDLGRRLRLPLGPSETASQYAHRASLQHPARSEAIQAMTQEYLNLRYGRQEAVTAGQIRAFRKRVRRV